MLLPKAHPIRGASEDREVRRLLNETEDALVLSKARLRKSGDRLSTGTEPAISSNVR